MRYLFLCLLLLSVGCKETGFRKMEGSSERAMIQSAQETLAQMEVALERFHEVHHRYPVTNESAIYDSLRDYFLITIDPANIYKNENDQSSYIAVGTRKNRVIYRCPATLGSGEFTLYWVGPNAIDEEGRGDDLFVKTNSMQKQLSHRTVMRFRDDSSTVEFILSATGSDAVHDSAIFTVKKGKNTLYEDRWPLRAYTATRPELSEREKQEIVNTEFDRFLRPSHFESADSLSKKPNNILTRRIDGKDFSDLLKAKLPVFAYYSPLEGPKAIYWRPHLKQIAEITLR